MVEPKHCRENAALCIEMANQAGVSQQQQAGLFEMANRWLLLAADLENGRSPALREVDGIRLRPQA